MCSSDLSSDGASAVESPVVIRQPLKHAAGLNWWRNIALVILMINFIPFCAMQIQNAIYPQLEPSFIPSQREMFQWRNPTSNSSSDLMANLGEADYPLNRPGLEGRRLPRIADEVEETALLPYQKQMRGYKGSSSNQQAQSQVSNLQYDPKTNIQTGVARPK